ncbi:hypothetical protein N7454_002073 [Penicillium verhagenii]|nr:hypothetical protein N7454_002073 [Penicillium verhagenii]
MDEFRQHSEVPSIPTNDFEAITARMKHRARKGIIHDIWAKEDYSAEVYKSLRGQMTKVI